MLPLMGEVWEAQPSLRIARLVGPSGTSSKTRPRPVPMATGNSPWPGGVNTMIMTDSDSDRMAADLSGGHTLESLSPPHFVTTPR